MTLPTLTGKSFMVGRYFVVATPLAGAAHMLRYTVYLDGKRIGAMASVPNESDCRALISA